MSLTSKKVQDVDLDSMEAGHDKFAATKRTESEDRENSMAHKLLLALLFTGWFSLTVGYNVTNKFTLKWAKMKVSLGWFQFFVGVPYVLFMWATGIRKMPRLTAAELLKLAPLGVFHCMTHVSAVVAMASGSVSFTHIVKAGEPITTAVLAAVITGQVYKWQVYAALVPVVVGIAITSAHQVEFAMAALIGALMSTLGSSLRGIYSKKIMVKPIGENLTPANLYGVLTIMSCLYMLPFWLCIEAFSLSSILATATASGEHTLTKIACTALLSGVCYYLYNEIAFLTLHHVQPITHAVANTFKRVFIITAAYFCFSADIEGWAWLGGAMAVGGVFGYSVIKQKYK